MFELLKNAIDVTDGTPVTVPNTDTAIKSYNVPNNKFEQLFVAFEVLITAAAGSTAQNLLIKIKSGTTVKKTFTFKVIAAANTFNIPFWTMFPNTPTSAISITISAAAADANTSVALMGFYVAGMD